MTADDLLVWLRASPFRPFRIITLDGRQYDVRRPEMVKLASEKAAVLLADSPTAPPDRYQTVSYSLIDRIEPLGPPPGWASLWSWPSPRAKARLVCPRCGSGRVTRAPADGLSPHPGHRCGDCGLRMRARGMAAVYLVVLALGLAVAALIAAGQLSEEEPSLPALVCPLCVWLAGAGYSAIQLTRPAPRRAPLGEPDE